MINDVDRKIENEKKLEEELLAITNKNKVLL